MSNLHQEIASPSRTSMPPMAFKPVGSGIANGATRRGDRRHDVRLDVELTLGDQIYPMATRRLSFGGAFIESELQPAFGRCVHLRFRVPTSTLPIEVGAVVRWRDARGFGVQFDGLRARAVWALGRFLASSSSVSV